MAASDDPPELRWTLVTGASSGIGAEIARVLARRGYPLVLTARRRERLESLAAEIAPLSPGTAIEVLPSDLEDPAAPAALLAVLEAKGIVLHTLVNNAGFGLRGRFATLPHDRLMAMIAVNIVALTDLSRRVLPGLIAARRGGILNVASTAAFQAGPYMGLYYATKAFVLSLSEALHEEAKPHGVTVTALCPGPTPTEFASIADLEMKRIFRVGTMRVEDVARIGVEGHLAGRAVVIPGALNRAGALGSKFLPRMLTRRAAGRLQR